MMADAQTIASALRGKRQGSGWVCLCPVHEADGGRHKPSLSVTEKDGRVLVHCHAGCPQEAVIEALRGMGLWEGDPRRVERARLEREAEHARVVRALAEADQAQGRELTEEERALVGDAERTLEAVSVPPGYRCGDDGVFLVPEEGDPERLTHAPVRVAALSRDGEAGNWGRLVEWRDHDGLPHELAIPAALFHAVGNELAQTLALGGLPIVPGKEKKLLGYLAAFRPEARLLAATATGWQGEAFVLPTMTLNEPEGERIVYQPQEVPDTAAAFTVSGSFIGWKDAVADAGELVRFAVCAALAAPLRLLAGIEAGGFHFYGQTSRGKTTLLQAVASVWGNGCDPAQAGGAAAFVQRWNATANALEALAESFNDLPLIIDEIGEGDEREFGKTIYRIMSGTGKGRAGRSGNLRRSKSWRVLVLSAGELAAAEYVKESGGKVRGGQIVRLVDIPADDLFPDAAAADAMKRAVADHHGHAGPAFLELGRDFLALRVGMVKPEELGEALTNEAERVRKRFALVAAAGEIAIEAKILPWEPGAALEASRHAFSLWRGALPAQDDAERGVQNVRDFILRHEARFEVCGYDPVTPRDRAGWVKDGLYHFTKEAFAEACSGVNQQTVLKALAERGLLHLQETGRHRSKMKVEPGKPPVSGYSVKIAILAGDSGDTGDSPCATRVSAVPGNPIPTGDGGDGPRYPSPVSPVVPTPPGTAESKESCGVSPPSPVSPVENDELEPGTGAQAPEGGASRHIAALALAATGLSVTPEEVFAELAPEDVRDLEEGLLTAEELRAFATVLAKRKGTVQRAAGDGLSHDDGEVAL